MSGLARDAHSNVWDHAPDNRKGNQGRGMCNTGSGKRVVCALGGIGCDVDHKHIEICNLIEAKL